MKKLVLLLAVLILFPIVNANITISVHSTGLEGYGLAWFHINGTELGYYRPYDNIHLNESQNIVNVVPDRTHFPTEKIMFPYKYADIDYLLNLTGIIMIVVLLYGINKNIF